jgi:hypothetical protein
MNGRSRRPYSLSKSTGSASRSSTTCTARDAVLARIPEGSSVTTNMSVTLQETEIADAIDRRATSSAALTDWEPMIAAGGRRHDEL